jgi:hypothetical protein
MIRVVHPGSVSLFFIHPGSRGHTGFRIRIDLMNILSFFQFFWVIYALLDPDPDPQFVCGSGFSSSN